MEIIKNDSRINSLLFIQRGLSCITERQNFIVRKQSDYCPNFFIELVLIDQQRKSF